MPLLSLVAEDEAVPGLPGVVMSRQGPLGAFTAKLREVVSETGKVLGDSGRLRPGPARGQTYIAVALLPGLRGGARQRWPLPCAHAAAARAARLSPTARHAGCARLGRPLIAPTGLPPASSCGLMLSSSRA